MHSSETKAERSIIAVGEWLDRLGLGRYRKLFAEQQISSDVVPQLTEADLERLDLPFGHRKKLMRAILAFGAAPLPPDDAPRSAGAKAERRNLTVVFIDMVGFAALASRLDPEDLREVMDAYMATCGGAVAAFGGHVAEYLGDGLVAYFGYPAAQEDAAERAVRAALRAVAAVGRLEPRPSVTLQARAGIATGLVVVGGPPAGSFRECTASGETPALAARLQALAQPAGVIIAAGTHRLLGGAFALECLGRQPLKGFEEPVLAWQVLGEAPASSRFTAAHAGPLTSIVDRTDELALLLDRWRLACRYGGQVVLLSGEPGVGKSRLLEALREHLAHRPHSFVCHQCSPHHSNSALHPAIRWLEYAAGIDAGAPPARSLAKLEALLVGRMGRREDMPVVADLLSIAPGGGGAVGEDPLSRRERTLRTLRRLLTEVAADRPRLFVLEDAHWSDPTTLELMDRVMRGSRSVPMLTVVSSRPDFEAPWRGQPGVTELALGRLPRRFCAELTEQLAGAERLPLELQDQILDRADGVALFVEELTKAVLESEPPTSAGDDGRTGRGRRVMVPATLQDSLMARLDRLGPVKAVAQVGAALGREFPYRLLAACVPLDEGDLRDALDRLVAAELLFSRGSPPEARYTFKHALVRDTAYDSLLHSRRRELHRRIAEAIEASFPGLAESQPELLAHHLTEADLPDSAAAWWSRAGRHALRRSANSEASSHLRRALDLLRVMPAGPERDRRELELRVQINAPLQVTKGFASAEVEANVACALALCKSLSDTSKTLPLLWGGCVTSIVRCDLRQALAKVQRFLLLAESEGNADAILTGHRGLGHALLVSGDIPTAASHFERALELYVPDRSEALIADYALDPLPIILGQHAMAMQQLGRSAEAAELARRAWREARRADHYGSSAYGAFQVALFHMIEGDVEALEEVATELLALSQRHGGGYWPLHCEILLGWRQAMAGATDAGLERVRRAEAERQRIQARLWTPLYLAQEGMLLTECGRASEALRWLEAGLSTTQATEQRFAEAELHRVRALALAAEGGRTEEVVACLNRAQEIARRCGARLWELRATATRALLLRGA